MKIIAQSPCRVDMAGGTVDIWPLYLYHENPVTLNFAVDRYTFCSVETRQDRKITLRSRDLSGSETFESIDALLATNKYKLPLAARLLRFFRPAMGLNLETHSEVPAGAGIAGSSSLMISTSCALNKLTGAGYSIEKIREIAQNVEAQIIRVPTGCQDYYPALYGGVSAIETGPAGIVRKEIPVDLEDFNERIVLAYTGEPRNSGINNWEVTKAHIDGDKAVLRNFARITAIAGAMRAALERADWKETARLLRAEWATRKKNAPGITTPVIDRLVEVTRKAGARGAKACGAGGGGCVFFLVERGARQRVESIVAAEGAEVLNVRIAPHGVRMKVSAD